MRYFRMRLADAIAFAQSAPVMVLLEGVARIGKSFAAQDCCERSAGLVRYIQTPARNDDLAFYRAFAKSLGVACSLSMKAQQIRDRVEEALQGAGVAVLIDEAHYCFDTYIRPCTMGRPARPRSTRSGKAYFPRPFTAAGNRNPVLMLPVRPRN